MLVASDLHGSLTSLERLLELIPVARPDLLVLLGDLVYHGPRNPLPSGYNTSAILDQMHRLSSAPCPLLAVRGNCDAEVDVELSPFPMPPDAWIKDDSLQIYACHGHRIPQVPPIPGIAPGTVILRGHTHIPQAETIEGIHFWNPGSLSLPKGGFPRSYGIVENGVFRVMDLNGQELMRHSAHGETVN